MTISQTVYNDLLKRVEKMTLGECKRMSANMGAELSDIDRVIRELLRDRIEQLQASGAQECE